MTETDLYSSRNIKVFMEYLHALYPGMDNKSILENTGMTIYQVEDEGHWFSQSQVDRFHDNLVRLTGNPDIALEAGRFAPFSKAAETMADYVVGFITPGTVFSAMAKLYPQVSRTCAVQTRTTRKNQVEITVRQKPGMEEKPYQCANRRGIFEGTTKLLTGKFPQIDHPDCMHAGGDCCRYIITWEPIRSTFWKRISGIAALLSLLLFAVLLFTVPGRDLLVYSLAAMLLNVGIFLRAVMIEKKDLRNIVRSRGESAGTLLDQISVRYNNAILMKEIGQYVSSILDTEQLLNHFMNALEKNLEFRRGLVMLANNERTRLVYRAGYGYSPEDEEFIKQTEFSLENPNSRGPLVVSFRKQVPFLIGDVDSIENNLSPRSLNFARTMGIRSFICVPITFEGRSEGILAVDNLKTDRALNETDISLLMGIAPQIGISINNARAYQQIREREEQFRALSENAPDIIYTTDTTGIFTYVNPAWEKLLGHNRNEVIGNYFVAYVKQDETWRFAELFREVHDRRRTFSGISGTILHKDGSELLFDMSGAPNLNAAGKVIGVVGTFRDVTKQRLLERQLLHASKMEAVGTLTGGIAHDFNNILQALGGYNRLLLMKKDESHPDWKYLSNIDSLNQRASEMIKQLLIFSRKVDIRLQAVDLNEEIKACHTLLKEVIPKMISTELDLDDRLWKIEGDPAQLGQIFMNLSVNARDAMPEGGILQITTENIINEKKIQTNGTEMPPGNFVLLKISDTGHGMDQETVTHIFEPFYSTKEAGQGTGLGLAVVYGIVANHGGHVLCRSMPDRGTTFNIFFPALIGDQDAQTAATASANELFPAGEETLLLVDDEEDVLETTKIWLEHYGYRVLTAGNGEEALRMFTAEKRNISLVILDLLMPGMGGIKCLDMMLNMDPRAQVLISSGYVPGSTQRDVMDRGAAGFLQKPYRHQDILNMIRGVLDKKAN